MCMCHQTVCAADWGLPQFTLVCKAGVYQQPNAAHDFNLYTNIEYMFNLVPYVPASQGAMPNLNSYTHVKSLHSPTHMYLLNTLSSCCPWHPSFQVRVSMIGKTWFLWGEPCRINGKFQMVKQERVCKKEAIHGTGI